METIIDEIIGTLDAGFSYCAISMALSLPDICASLQLPAEANTRDSVKSRYQQWFTKYLAEKYQFLTPEDVYSLRNGVVHQGSFGHKNSQFERVVFTIRDETRGMHNNLVDFDGRKFLQLNARVFCEDVIEAVRKWQADTASNKDVDRNMSRVVQAHPDGYSPVVSGSPAVA